MQALFDTNILIDYLNGIAAAKQEINRYSELKISLISSIEVLSGVRKAQEELIVLDFLKRFESIPLTENIANLTIQLRREHRLKLGDAIILATSQIENCLLVTRDKKDFPRKFPNIRHPYRI